MHRGAFQRCTGNRHTAGSAAELCNADSVSIRHHTKPAAIAAGHCNPFGQVLRRLQHSLCSGIILEQPGIRQFRGFLLQDQRRHLGVRLHLNQRIPIIPGGHRIAIGLVLIGGRLADDAAILLQGGPGRVGIQLGKQIGQLLGLLHLIQFRTDKIRNGRKLGHGDGAVFPVVDQLRHLAGGNGFAHQLLPCLVSDRTVHLAFQQVQTHTK